MDHRRPLPPGHLRQLHICVRNVKEEDRGRVQGDRDPLPTDMVPLRCNCHIPDTTNHSGERRSIRRRNQPTCQTYPTTPYLQDGKTAAHFQNNKVPEI